MEIRESGEMYLETVLRLSEKGSPVRSIDVAEELGYSKPSVSRAVGLLRKGGYLLMDEAGYLTLTEEGHAVAVKIYERHRILSRMLMRLGVDEVRAADDACKIEHVISDETFAAIKRHMEEFGG